MKNRVDLEELFANQEFAKAERIQCVSMIGRCTDLYQRACPTDLSRCYLVARMHQERYENRLR